MRLYSLTVTGGPPIVGKGLIGILQPDGTIDLDDELLPVTFSPKNKLTEIPAENDQRSVSVEDGFFNVGFQEIQVDTNPAQNYGTIVIHFKVRIKDSSPICEIYPLNPSHKPLISGVESDSEKSFIFAMQKGDEIRLIMGGTEYLFEVKENMLQMHDLTNPVWPPTIRSPRPSSSDTTRRSSWWKGFFRRNRRPPTFLRIMHQVD